MRTLRCWALATVLASVAVAQAQAGKKHAGATVTQSKVSIFYWKT
jgi:hypothetical protein